MAVMKKKIRKRLTKYLARLVKKHGAEMTLALVTGIVSSLAAETSSKAARNATKVRKVAKAPLRPAANRTAALRTAPARPVVVRKRATR